MMRRTSIDWAELCAQTHEDDGKPLRRRAKDQDRTSTRRKRAKKRDQLCHQIAQSVTMTIPTLELDDPALEGLIVHSVEPAPDAHNLRVILSPAAPVGPDDEPLDLAQLQARLKGLEPAIRASIARDIHRKRTPQIELLVIPYPS